MGAFVSPKDTYRVPLTLEDCPSMDREEWVDVIDGLTTKTMMEMQGAEGVSSGIVFLRDTISDWSFEDDKGKKVPVTAENIDRLQLEIILRLLAVTQEKLPLVNRPAQPSATPAS